jgi:clostripain
MLIKISAIIVFMIALVSLSGCGGGGDSGVNRTINEPASGWTIMVWLDADNNLESAAMQDLNEMEYGLYLAGIGDSAITDKVKIIVQVDRYGSASSSYTGDSWSDTRRYIIRPDSANSTKWTSQRIDNDLGEINMGDADNLADFVEYCQEHFPSPQYALILWNHGGGLRKKSSSLTSVSDSSSSGTSNIKAICWDDTNGDDALYTGEITDVLTDIHSVDFLGFDACLMGMLEVAYEYRPGVTGKFGADAISFSPANEQGDGWNYERILNRLKGSGTDAEGDACYNADSLTANQFATLVAKEYADDDSTYSDE